MFDEQGRLEMTEETKPPDWMLEGLDKLQEMLQELKELVVKFIEAAEAEKPDEPPAETN